MGKIILVTNDDGVRSPGIKALFKAMQAVGDAYMVAPDRERSAVGHALTMHRPLKVERLGRRAWSVNGTPTDCVALGIGKLLPSRPDLIVSGINRGGNLGDDITYSGTVSAAIEGTIMGIESLAFSLLADGPRGPKPDYGTAARFARRTARFVLENGLPYDTLLNVNIPNAGKEGIKGVRFTRQSKRVYQGAIHEASSPWGEVHYWIGGGNPLWERGDDMDMEAVMEGYVSITPIHLDLTNGAAIDWLRKRWNGDGA
ncbi:MAG: 5'/3'-nucleotidase SurE [Nitrospiraceae bacterium]|nr:5'/3'-nucleotidase SurE [Nitrospiraceae bacterium]